MLKYLLLIAIAIKCLFDIAFNGLYVLSNPLYLLVHGTLLLIALVIAFWREMPRLSSHGTRNYTG